MLNYMDEYEARSEVRFECNFNVNIMLDEEACDWRMLAVDISSNGLRVCSYHKPKLLTLKKEVKIYIEKIIIGEALTFNGMIAHISKSDNRHIYGIKLIVLDEETVSRWDEVINVVRLGQKKVEE